MINNLFELLEAYVFKRSLKLITSKFLYIHIEKH